jgi:hypothetical protein
VAWLLSDRGKGEVKRTGSGYMISREAAEAIHLEAQSISEDVYHHSCSGGSALATSPVGLVAIQPSG